jgi:hypothetical protein
MHQNSNLKGILIMKQQIMLIVLCSLILGACTVVNQQSTPPPQKTQLQTRQVQTREYDTNDVKLVMKAVLNVLQDDGFIVRNAQIELGLLTATKEVDLQSRNSGSNQFWSDFFRGLDRNRGQRESLFNKLKQIESSVNVSEFGKQSKVRANFQVKILDNQGNTVEVYQVEDPKFYQEFFMKVDKGIFIQKQGF